MACRKPLTADGALRVADTPIGLLADAMRRSPKPSTRAMILNRTLAALEHEMPDAELREEMAHLRRRALRVILPDHREAPRLVDLFPDLLALRAGAKA